MLKKADINKAVQRIVLGDGSRATRKFKSYQDEVLLLLNSNPDMVFDLVWFAGQEILSQVDTIKPMILGIMRLTKAVPTRDQADVISAVERLDETTQQVKGYPSGMPVMGPMWDALDKMGESLRKAMQIPKGGVEHDDEYIYLQPTMEQALRDLPALLGQFQYEWRKLQGRIGTVLKTIDSFNQRRGSYQDKASLVLMDNIAKITAKMKVWVGQKDIAAVMSDADSIITYTEAIRSVLLSNAQGGSATQKCIVADNGPAANKKPKGNTLMMYPVKPFRVPIIKSKNGPFRLPTDGAILRIKIGDPLKLYTVDFSNTPSGGDDPIDIDIRDRPILPLELNSGSDVSVKWNQTKHLGTNRIFVRTPQTPESGVPPYPDGAESICVPLLYPTWSSKKFSEVEDKIHTGIVSLDEFIDAINDKAAVSGVYAYRNPNEAGKFYLVGGTNSGFVEIMKEMSIGIDLTPFSLLPDEPPGDDLTQPSKTSFMCAYGAGGFAPGTESLPALEIKHSHLFWENFAAYDHKFQPPSLMKSKFYGIDVNNTVNDQIKMVGSISYCPFVDAAYILDFIVRDAELYGKLDTEVVTVTKVNQQTWNFEETGEKLFGDDSPSLVKFTLDDPTAIDWVGSVALGLIMDTELGRLYITDVDYNAGSESITALLYGPYNSNPFTGAGTVKGSVLEEYFTLKPKATDKNGTIKLEGDQAIFDALGLTPGLHKPTADSFVIAGRPHGGTKRKEVIQPKQYGMKLGSIVTLLNPPIEFTVESITPPVETIEVPGVEPPDNEYETVIHTDPTTEVGWIPFDWFGPFTVDNGHTATAVAKLHNHHATAVYGGDFQQGDVGVYKPPKAFEYGGTLHQGGQGPTIGPGIHVAPPSAEFDTVGITDEVIETEPTDPIEIDPRVWGGIDLTIFGPDDFGVIDKGLLDTGLLVDGTDLDFTTDMGELTEHLDPETGRIDIDVDSVLGQFGVDDTLTEVIGEFTEPTIENQGIIQGIFDGLQSGGYDRALEALKAGNLDSFMSMNEVTARGFGAMVTLGAAAGQLLGAQQALAAAQTGGSIQQGVQLGVGGSSIPSGGGLEGGQFGR